MYSKSATAFRFLNYYIQASNSRGHGIHSPFVYQFVTDVLNDEQDYPEYGKIEQVKNKMLQDGRLLESIDFGAGAEIDASAVKKISAIARKSVSSKKFGRLLFRIAKYYSAETIIELGSSLGISTAYLASASPASHMVTIEGSAALALVARENFDFLGLHNIVQVNGQFDEKLNEVISSNPAAGLIFIDGNHRKKPVLDYFEQFMNKKHMNAIIIFHDIHWSKEMEEAWIIIQQDHRVKMTIDIFSAGLIFFREELKVKQHFIIRF